MSDKSYVSVPADAVEWLRRHYPELCVKAGLCEKVGGRVYLRTQLQAASNEHPDDLAWDRFAAAGKAKMAASRAKGRGGWDNPDLCPAGRLQTMLIDHLAKGDPVDIGNFAMMLFNRGESVAAPTERFFMDHGLWHDRETGQHLWTQDQYDEQSRAQYLAGAEDQANGVLPEWAKVKINVPAPTAPSEADK